MEQPLYSETFRPQFHFTARQWTDYPLNPRRREEGWLNDLNGMIFYEGEYHLFAQRWNRCWIHAISRDLIHWEELPPAIWEEHLGTGIDEGSGVQSGTCVVDYKNTSGLSPDKSVPPLIAFWSRNDNRSHCISYSLDRGRTWKHYDKNPVLVKPERDPKVFWHQPGKQWVMMLYGDQKYHILTSQNLLSWKDEGKAIDNSFECPDIFQLPVDGNHDQQKWVLIRGDGKYSIGDFDGSAFNEETDQLVCDVGPNFYATQTFENTTTGDGRRIQTAWMREGVYPDMPFNQQISFPCECTLRTTPHGIRLFRQPVKEIALLQSTPDVWTHQTLIDGKVLQLKTSGDLFRILAKITVPPEATLKFNVLGSELIVTSNAIESGEARAQVFDVVRTLEILVDRTSIEAFLNEGEISSSRCILPTQSGVSITAEQGAVTIHSLTIYPLKSIWRQSHPQGI